MATTTTTNLIRLNKFISDHGIASRREADELISTGQVFVNGKLITELGTKVSNTDKVAVNGKVIKSLPTKKYIIFHKPKDVITTTKDERSRETVMDYISTNERIYPIGRLDRNTTGILLFTNDGELARRLMSPKYQIEKEYVATLDKKVSATELTKFKKGMNLKDTGEKVQPCEVKIIEDGKTVWVCLKEGKNRQVHRMFWSIGYDVKKLARVCYAGIALKGLKRGAWRDLTESEVYQLYSLVKLNTQKI